MGATMNQFRPALVKLIEALSNDIDELFILERGILIEE
jgi:hypothetical protein